VLNLTVNSRQFVSNLDDAIASVNYQVASHFQQEWGVGGKLVNKTADFNLHLNFRQNRQLVGPNSPQFGAQIVDWIVNNEEGIDWSNTGIVYVTDPQTSFGGVHVDEKVQALDIPYALVGARDKNWSVVLSHEVLELLADPWGSRFVQYQSNQPITYLNQETGQTESKVVAQQDWIVEVCDAVEADADGYAINGVQVSNFVGQAYYNTSVTSNLDYRHLLQRTDPAWPFPIRQGGYLSFWDANNANDLYQITWFNGDEPIYTKLNLGNAKVLEHYLSRQRDNHHHRILKYWRTRKRVHKPHSKL